MILEPIQLLFGNYALHLVLVSKPNCFLLELYLVQWILVLRSLEFCLLGMLQEKTNNYMRGFFKIALNNEVCVFFCVPFLDNK